MYSELSIKKKFGLAYKFQLSAPSVYEVKFTKFMLLEAVIIWKYKYVKGCRIIYKYTVNKSFFFKLCKLCCLVSSWFKTWKLFRSCPVTVFFTRMQVMYKQSCFVTHLSSALELCHIAKKFFYYSQNRLRRMMW